MSKKRYFLQIFTALLLFAAIFGLCTNAQGSVRVRTMCLGATDSIKLPAPMPGTGLHEWYLVGNPNAKGLGTEVLWINNASPADAGTYVCRRDMVTSPDTIVLQVAVNPIPGEILYNGVPLVNNQNVCLQTLSTYSIPEGMRIDSFKVVGGTPTSSVNSTITVTWSNLPPNSITAWYRDALGCIYEATYAVQTNPLPPTPPAPGTNIVTPICSYDTFAAWAQNPPGPDQIYLWSADGVDFVHSVNARTDSALISYGALTVGGNYIFLRVMDTTTGCISYPANKSVDVHQRPFVAYFADLANPTWCPQKWHETVASAAGGHKQNEQTLTYRLERVTHILSANNGRFPQGHVYRDTAISISSSGGDSIRNLSFPHVWTGACGDSIEMVFRVIEDNNGCQSKYSDKLMIADDVSTIKWKFIVEKDVFVNTSASCVFDANAEVINKSPIATSDCFDSIVPLMLDLDTVDLPASQCPYVKLIHRQWTATTTCGGILIDTQNIYISNAFPPVANTAALINPATIYRNGCSYDASPSNPLLGEMTDSASCSTPIITYRDSMVGGACPQDSVLIRKWYVRDSCGHETMFPNGTNAFVQIINVIDTTKPVLDHSSLLSTITRNYNAYCQPDIAPAQGQRPTAVRNCTGTSRLTVRYEDHLDHACPTRQYTRTWFVEDSCKMQADPTRTYVATWTQTITVVDTGNTGTLVFFPDRGAYEEYIVTSYSGACNAPAWGNVPAPTLPYRISGSCSGCVGNGLSVATVNQGAAMSNDGCQTAVSREYRLIQNGNTIATLQQQVIIKNRVPITMTMGTMANKDTITVYRNGCNVSISPSNTGQPAANGACPQTQAHPDYSDQMLPGACPQDSVIRRTWSGTDNCGNRSVFPNGDSTFIQIINVIDTTTPVIDHSAVPDTVTVYVQGNCGFNIEPTYQTTPTAQQNCMGNSVLSLSQITNELPAPPDCQRRYERIWRAVDSCKMAEYPSGNYFREWRQIIKVVDTAQVRITALPGRENDTLYVTELDNEDCYCRTVSAPTLPYHISGSCGLCNAQIVVDTTRFNAMPFNGTLGPCEAEVVRNLSVIDPYTGTQTTIQYVLTLFDRVAPVVTGMPVKEPTIYRNSGDCSYNKDTSRPELGAVRATKTCSDPIITYRDTMRAGTLYGLCPQDSVIVRTWRVKDTCGNIGMMPNDEGEEVAVYRQIIYVIDTAKPEFETYPSDTLLVFVNNDCAYPDTLATSATTPTKELNCNRTSQLTITHSDAEVLNVDNHCVPVTYNGIQYGVQKSYTRTWKVEDDCKGYYKEWTQTLLIIDTTPPNLVITKLIDTVYTTADAGCQYNANPEATPNPTPYTVSDFCGESQGEINVVHVDLDTVRNTCGMTITRQWTATDACGNSISKNQTIRVLDTVKPYFTQFPNTPDTVKMPDARADVLVFNPPVSMFNEARAEDNCTANIVPVSTTESMREIAPCLWYIERKWTITDDCGNKYDSIQPIYVKDSTPPEGHAPAEATVYATATSCRYSEISDPMSLTGSVVEIAHPNHTGGKSVMDVRDNIDPNPTVTYKDTVIKNANGCGWRITRVWFISDACGNMKSDTQHINILDDVSPTLEERTYPRFNVVYKSREANGHCSYDLSAFDVDAQQLKTMLTARDNCTDSTTMQDSIHATPIEVIGTLLVSRTPNDITTEIMNKFGNVQNSALSLPFTTTSTQANNIKIYIRDYLRSVILGEIQAEFQREPKMATLRHICDAELYMRGFYVSDECGNYYEDGAYSWENIFGTINAAKLNTSEILNGNYSSFNSSGLTFPYQLFVVVDTVPPKVEVRLPDKATCKTLPDYPFIRLEQIDPAVMGIPTYTSCSQELTYVEEVPSLLENRLTPGTFGYKDERHISLLPTADGYVDRIWYAMNECGVVTYDTQRIDVTSQPTVWLARDQMICEGNDLVITANVYPANVEYSYEWIWWGDSQNLAELLEDQTTPILTMHDLAVTTYGHLFRFTAYNDASGCFVQAFDTIFVRPAFARTMRIYTDAPFDQGQHIICENTGLTLTADVDLWDEPIDMVYQWYKDNEPIEGAIYPVLVDTISEGHAYRFEISPRGGESCNVVSNTINVAVLPAPVINILQDFDTICQGGEVNLTAHLNSEMLTYSNQGSITYQWYKDGNAIPYATDLTYLATDAGKYWFTAVQNRTGCTATMGLDTATVTVLNVLPTLNKTDLDSVYCLNSQVAMSVNIDGTIPGFGTETYTWRKNGMEINNLTANHFIDVLPTSGITMYEIKVQTAVSGCVSAWDTAWIFRVLTAPDIMISGNSLACGADSAQVNLTANLLPTSANHVYQWYLNNAPIANATDSVYKNDYYQANINPYNFAVQVRDTVTGCIIMSSLYPVFIENVTNNAIIVSTSRTPCNGEDVTLTVTNVGANDRNMTYQWFKNGVALTDTVNGAVSNVYTYPAGNTSDTFTFEARQIGTSCGRNSNPIIINPVAKPDNISLHITSARDTICAGGEIYLSVPSIPNMKYVWYENGVKIENADLNWLRQNNFSQTCCCCKTSGNVETHTYNVRLESLTTGCLADDWSDTATVVIYCNPTVVISGEPILCNDSNIVLAANVSDKPATANFKYEWRLSNAVIANTTVDTLRENRPASNHSYIYTVEARDTAKGCIALSAPFEVRIDESPKAFITATDDSICEGGRITMIANLIDNNRNDVRYVWGHKSSTGELADTLGTFRSLTINPQPNDTFMVVITHSSSGCTETVTKAITVNPKPELTVSAVSGIDTVCTGGVVILSAGVTGGVAGGEVYTWYVNNTLIPNTIGDTLIHTPVIANGTRQTYKAVVRQSALGCTSDYASVSGAKTIEVIDVPSVVVVSNSGSAVCPEATLELTANVFPTSSTASFTWFENAAEIPNHDTNVLSVANKASGTYTYEVAISQYGCTPKSAPLTITVKDTLLVAVNGNADTICEGGNVTFTANVTPADNYNYAWSFDNGATFQPGSNLVSINKVFADTGIQNVVLRVIPTYGNGICVKEASFVVKVNPKPRLVVTTTPDTICTGGVVIASAVIDSGGVAGGEVYTWYVNNTLIPNTIGDTLIHAPVIANGTTQTYKAIVSQTASGCISDYNAVLGTKTVEVRDVPVVAVVSNTSSFATCPEEPFLLTANVVPSSANVPTTFTWFENNIEMSDDSAVFIVENRPPGTYIYVVAVTQYGYTQRSTPIAVTVKDTMVVGISTSEDTICEGGNITFTTNISPADNYTYSWSFDNGVTFQTGSNLSSINKVFADTGIQNVILRVSPTDCDGNCVKETSISVKVNPKPRLVVTTTPDTICTGGVVIASAVIDSGGVAGGEVYTWYANNVLIPNTISDTLIHAPVIANGTTQTYKAIVSQTASGCISDYASVTGTNTVEVRDVPVVVIVPNINGSAICPEEPFVLTANVVPPSANTTFTWYENNVEISVQDTNTLSVENRPSGTYTYEVAVTQYGSTQRSAPVTITVKDTMLLGVNTSEDTICEGGNITFTTSIFPNDNYSYAWSFDNGVTFQTGGNLSTITKMFSDTGTQNVILRVIPTYGNGNCYKDTIFTVRVNPKPELSVTTSPDTICTGGVVVVSTEIISGGVAGGEVYTWYVNNVLIPNTISDTLIHTPIIANGTTQTYKAIVSQAASGCTSDYASVTGTKTVEVKDRPVVVVVSNINGSATCPEDAFILTANVVPSSDSVSTIFTWYENNVEISVQDTNRLSVENKAPGIYIYEAAVTQYGYTQRSAPVTITVKDTLVVAVNTSADTICEGGTVSFTANVTPAGNYDYAWSFDNGNTFQTGSNLSSINRTFANAGTDTVILKVMPTYGNGNCVKENSFIIKVNAKPSITVNTTNSAFDTVCTGSVVFVSATIDSGGFAGGETYTWYVNNILVPNTIGDTLIHTPVIANGAIQTYRAVVTQTASGCTSDYAFASAVKTVAVRDFPAVVVVSNSGSAVCPEATFELTANVVPSSVPTTFTWFVNNVEIPNQDTNVLTVADKTPGIYTYEASANQYGCTQRSAPVTITVKDTLVVAVNTSADTICEGGNVTFTANVTPAGNYDYSWSFDNGNTFQTGSNLSSINRAFANAGTDTIILKVMPTYGNGNCVKETSFIIKVNAKPSVTVNTTNSAFDTVCTGSVVVVSATIDSGGFSGGETYTWYVNNILVPNTIGDTLIHTPVIANGATQTYRAVVTQTASGCTSDYAFASAVKTVAVKDFPAVVVVSNSGSAVCPEATFELTANVVPTSAPTTFAWYVNNVEIPNQDTSVLTVSNNAPGIYTYEASVNQHGCTQRSAPVTITVKDTLVVAVNMSETSICDSGRITFTANVTPADNYNYAWSFDGGASFQTGSNLTTISNMFKYADGQTQNITLRVLPTYGNGNCVKDTNFSITVNPKPALDLTPSSNNICEGSMVNFSADVDVANGGVAGGERYTWYRNGIQIFGAVNTVSNTLSDVPVNGGMLIDSMVYTYTVTVSQAASGCTATAGTPQQIVVRRTPVVNITPLGSTTICEGTPLQIHANVSPLANTTYQWYEDNAPIANSNHAVDTTRNDLPAGIHTYKVTATQASGCTPVSNIVTVTVLAKPTVSLFANHDTACTGGTFAFTASPSTNVFNYNYEWKINGTPQNSVNGNTITRNLAKLQENTVKVTMYPTFDNNCAVTDSMSVYVRQQPVLTVHPDVDAICAGGIVNLRTEIDWSNDNGNLEIPNKQDYEWQINGHTIFTATHSGHSEVLSLVQNHKYSVRMMQKDDLGCRTEYADTFVNVVAQPKVAIATTDSLRQICVGGEVELQATVTDTANKAVYGTPTYVWYWQLGNATWAEVSLANNDSLLQATLTRLGRYDYHTTVTFAGRGCKPAESNLITYDVVAQPSWNTVTINPSGTVCAGEQVELTATVQGGVRDAAGNTNGTVQWLADGTPVAAGLGGHVFDFPKKTTEYKVVYNNLLGNGCKLDTTEGTTINLSGRPYIVSMTLNGTTTDTMLCGNDVQSIINLEVEFAGQKPFRFELSEATQHGIVKQLLITHDSFYTMQLRPTETAVYTISMLEDATICPAYASTLTASVTIHVTHIDNISMAVTCGEPVAGQPPLARVYFDIVSLPFNAMYKQATVFYNGKDTVHNVLLKRVPEAILTMGNLNFMEFATPEIPGDYEMYLDINGCIYPFTLKVLKANTGSGATPLVTQRWHDVVVVNNNPNTNGGYTFTSYQWYKNGEPIAGATGQFYQEMGGLNGYYAVLLTYIGPDGKPVQFMTCETYFAGKEPVMSVAPNPARRFQEITIYTSLSQEELEGAVLNLYTITGQHLKEVRITSNIIKIEGFASPAAYIGKITTGTKETKTVKMIVIE